MKRILKLLTLVFITTSCNNLDVYFSDDNIHIISNDAAILIPSSQVGELVYSLEHCKFMNNIVGFPEEAYNHYISVEFTNNNKNVILTEWKYVDYMADERWFQHIWDDCIENDKINLALSYAESHRYAKKDKLMIRAVEINRKSLLRKLK